MISSSILAVSAAGIAMLGVAYLLARTFKQQKLKIAALEKTLTEMSQDFRVQTSSALNMGERLKRLERRTFGQASSGKSSIKDDDPIDNAYTEAAKILENGGDVQDIVKKCNISTTEAELIESLYQQMQDADIVS